MEMIEKIIEGYVNEFGSEQEKKLHPLYKGHYQTLFPAEKSSLEESIEFSGGEVMLFTVLVFVLETVGKSIVQDGYKLSKEMLLKYLKKDKNKLLTETKEKNDSKSNIIINNIIIVVNNMDNDL